MKNIVYLIGAGFSAPLEIPTMKNFYRVSKKINIEGKNHFKRIFDYWEKTSPVKNYIRINMLNIEELLSLLEMDNYLNENNLLDDMKLYIADVVNNFLPSKIQRSLPIEKTDLPDDWILRIYPDKKLKEYGYFFLNQLNLNIWLESDYNQWKFRYEKNDEPIHNYSIVTFNYDLVFESLEKILLSNLPPSNEGLQKFIKNNSKDGIYELIKLHGSSDNPKSIIPPTWNKIQSEERRNYWKKAHDLLSNASEIRVLGYSLPTSDTYFRYFLMCCLKDSKNLEKFTVLTLDNDDVVKNNYKNFFDENTELLEFYSADIYEYLLNIYQAFEKNLLNNTWDKGFSTFGVEEGHKDFISKIKNRTRA